MATHHRQAPAQTVPLEWGRLTIRSSGRGRPEVPQNDPVLTSRTGTRPNRASGGGGAGGPPVAARPPGRPPQNDLVPTHYRQIPAQAVPLEGGDGRPARRGTAARTTPPKRPLADTQQTGTRPNRPFGGVGAQRCSQRGCVSISVICQLALETQAQETIACMHVIRLVRGSVRHSTTDSPSTNLSHASA